MVLMAQMVRVVLELSVELEAREQQEVLEVLDMVVDLLDGTTLLEQLVMRLREVILHCLVAQEVQVEQEVMVVTEAMEHLLVQEVRVVHLEQVVLVLLVDCNTEEDLLDIT
jgi:hypothetical protein